MKNQRQSKRYPVNIEVVYRLENPEQNIEGEWQDGTLLTASEHGVFLKTDFPIKRGQRVRFKLPLHNDELLIGGTVAWTTKENPLGGGIQFDEISKSDRKNLGEVIISGKWFEQSGTSEIHDFFSDDINNIIDDLDLE